MNILFDYQIFCLQSYGGISRYFFELNKNICSYDGYRSGIFSPFHINRYLSDAACRENYGRFIGDPYRIGRYFSYSLDTMLSFFKVRRSRYVDIYHETYYSGIDLCPKSAKRVVTVHDMIKEKFPDQFNGSSRVIERKYLSIMRSDHVICISENTRNDLIDIYGIPAEKTSVVYLGNSIESKKINYESAQSHNYILFVGNRSGYKNFIGLLNAYAISKIMINDFYLYCFGGGDLSREEIDIIENLNIPMERIKLFSGGDDVLAKLYSNASVFVYPSMYEGFGIPPLEAMSFGCPVVCSGTSSLPEVVGNAARKFDPMDCYEMRDAIELVLTSRDQASNLVDCGYKRIEKFSWNKCAKDTLDVYEKII